MSDRQLMLVQQMCDHIAECKRHLEAGYYDLLAESLTAVRQRADELVGKKTTEDLLGDILAIFVSENNDKSLAVHRPKPYDLSALFAESKSE